MSRVRVGAIRFAIAPYGPGIVPRPPRGLLFDVEWGVRMRKIDGKIDHPYTIDEDTAVHGMICGTTTVKDAATLDLHGMISADLIVEMGGIAHIHGMVNGTVWNKGGQVTVHGMIDSLVEEPGSLTTLSPDSVIRDRQPPI